METPEDSQLDTVDKMIDEIVEQGPSGAFAVAGVATFIVVAMFFIFYYVVYLPRGVVQ